LIISLLFQKSRFIEDWCKIRLNNILIHLKKYIQNDKNSFYPEYFEINNKIIPKYISEFWTSKQRQASSIHEISYRACFKPQLPKFFIEFLSEKSDVIYDPFSGRGTTVIEAGLLERNIIANDINPLSKIFSYPRFFIPPIDDIKKRLSEIDLIDTKKADIDLSMFYHPKTEAELVSLQNYLSYKSSNNEEDNLDKWIRMVATNRLTGHSKGFFSVYTFPPNQAISQESQIKINQKRNQKPEYKNVKEIILNKSKDLIKNLSEKQKICLKNAGENGLFLTKDARDTNEIRENTIQLTITSPPFLDIVNYSEDNWLRCWFNLIDVNKMSNKITIPRNINEWSDVMKDVFKELFRITKNGGYVAFEVGEVRKGKVKLDEHIVPIGIKNGFECICIIINSQTFTKTSNIWGIDNNKAGTNTNRIVLFQKV